MAGGRKRWTLRRAMVAVALVAIGLGAFTEAMIRPVREHSRQYRRVHDDLKSLVHRRPPGVSRARWSYVVGWTLNAHANCTSFNGSVRPADLRRFADALEARLRDPVTLDTIDWIWDEYRRISVYGPSYDRYRPTRPANLAEADQGSPWLGLEVD